MNKSDNTTPHKAANYNNEIRNTIPFYDSFLEETINIVRILKPSVKIWLDTGCGTGTLVTRAFLHFPDTRFVLADPSESMLNQARKFLGEIPESCLHFLNPAGTENIRTGTINIPQPDVITAIQCHHYMDKSTRLTATRNCFELLSEGGIYITFENVRPDSERGTALALDRWARFQLSRGKTEEMVSEHRQRFNTVYFPITIGEHLQLLKECGFATCELFWHSYMQAGFYAIKE